jgi:DNA-binding NarL/FixJ family response regulator
LQSGFCLECLSAGCAHLSTKRRKRLSPREIEVVRLLAAGESNKSIAYHLDISENTVKGYSAAVYSKLGLRTPFASPRVALANWWHRHRPDLFKEAA